MPDELDPEKFLDQETSATVGCHPRCKSYPLQEAYRSLLSRVLEKETPCTWAALQRWVTLNAKRLSVGEPTKEAVKNHALRHEPLALEAREKGLLG